MTAATSTMGRRTQRRSKERLSTAAFLLVSLVIIIWSSTNNSVSLLLSLTKKNEDDSATTTTTVGPLHNSNHTINNTEEYNQQPTRSTTTSNKTATLCLVVKDPQRYYIDEWADYHMIAMGFTGLRIYDNDSPNFSLQGWGHDKPYAHAITRIRFVPGETHNVSTKGEVTYIQDTAYSDCVRAAVRENTDWVAAFDEDEFLILRNHGTILDFMERYCPPPCAQISFNWIVFGSNNKTRHVPVPVTRRFLYSSPRSPKGKWVKSIVDPQAVDLSRSWIHTFPLKRGRLWKDTTGRVLHGRKRWHMQFNHQRPVDVAALHHYARKSLQEFHDKTCVRKDVNRIVTNCTTPANASTTTAVPVLSSDDDDIGPVQFDDSAWQRLRRSVPAFQRYDEVQDLGE
mmetsp:Transcript_5627/g.11628  ORF Transcript_5627/g.11628 Transcript_5627/m.11628 type:complete len:398 (+) Transcript_5627:7-1200(+)